MLGYPINPHLSPIEPPSTPVNLIKPSSLNSHKTPRKPQLQPHLLNPIKPPFPKLGVPQVTYCCFNTNMV